MNGAYNFLIPAAVLILAALALFLLTRKRGLPAGSVIYEDLIRDGRPAPVLTSGKYGLSGKPDMIIRTGKELIPVEIKHAPGRDRPRPSHVMQLAAYCLLIEENYGVRPSLGIIRYRDRQFEVPYTDRLRTDLLDTISAMRSADPDGELPPRCKDRRRCAFCGYAGACAEAERQ